MSITLVFTKQLSWPRPQSQQTEVESRFKEDIVTTTREATSSLNLSLCVCEMGSMVPGSLARSCGKVLRQWRECALQTDTCQGQVQQMTGG